MYLENEVDEVIKWADQMANKFKTSPLNILIKFDSFYKKLRDIKMAKQAVERFEH